MALFLPRCHVALQQMRKKLHQNIAGDDNLGDFVESSCLSVIAVSAITKEASADTTGF